MRIDDITAEALLDSLFGSGSPATWYLGIILSAPADDGTGYTEPSTGSYARISKTNNSTNFPACVANSRTKLLHTLTTFPTASASWGTATGLGFFTVSPYGTGVCKFYCPFPDGPRAINNGNTPEFAVDAVQITVI